MSQVVEKVDVADQERDLRALYRTRFGTEATRFTVLRADGSNREIFRLEGEVRAIGVVGPERAENRAFVSYARSLREAGLPVPEIYAVADDLGCYLQEDLGSQTLYGLLESTRGVDSESVPGPPRLVYRRTVQLLPRLQVAGGRSIDFSLGYPRAAFDRRSVMWDLHYFKYLFLKLAEVPFDEDRLENELEQLADAILQEEQIHFMARDFQSRNIMVRPDESGELAPWFIDFQGGRRGPLGYDLASLLYDAKADLPPSFREEMLQEYLDALGEEITVDRDRFVRRFPLFILVRALQAMGAYGYRGLYQGKEHFVASIPFAVRNVRRILSRDFPLRLPEIEGAFDRLAERYPEGTAREPWRETTGTLGVEIRSFGFPRGSYPVDSAGHGGGHIFDCRVLDNPGRLAEFRERSGRDRGVIEFLEARQEVHDFYRHAFSLARRSVERYLARGFDSLSIGFGCTGGQHRSVYMAERLAEDLRAKYGARLRVTLEHRERENWQSSRPE